MLADVNGVLGKSPYGRSLKNISEESFNSLRDGSAGWEFAENTADFEKWAEGNVEADKKHFGLAPVASTLQQGRDGNPEDGARPSRRTRTTTARRRPAPPSAPASWAQASWLPYSAPSPRSCSLSAWSRLTSLLCRRCSAKHYSTMH